MGFIDCFFSEFAFPMDKGRIETAGMGHVVITVLRCQNQRLYTLEHTHFSRTSLALGVTAFRFLEMGSGARSSASTARTPSRRSLWWPGARLRSWTQLPQSPS